MASLELSRRDRRIIHQLLAQPGDAITLRRAQALAWLAAGESVSDIARRLRVSRQVIYQWVALFQERTELEPAARLASGARSGRPPTAQGIIDPLLDEVIEVDPREFDYHSTIWTAPLLVEYLAATHDLRVSVQSVRLALARLGISWKRPRHQLALRSATWQQAKGGLKRGWRRASAPSS